MTSSSGRPAARAASASSSGSGAAPHRVGGRNPAAHPGGRGRAARRAAKAGGHPVQATELGQRLGVVVDPQVEDALVGRRIVCGDDDEPGRLPAAEVAARRLRRVGRRRGGAPRAAPSPW